MKPDDARALQSELNAVVDTVLAGVKGSLDLASLLRLCLDCVAREATLKLEQQAREEREREKSMAAAAKAEAKAAADAAKARAKDQEKREREQERQARAASEKRDKELREQSEREAREKAKAEADRRAQEKQAEAARRAELARDDEKRREAAKREEAERKRLEVERKADAARTEQERKRTEAQRKADAAREEAARAAAAKAAKAAAKLQAEEERRQQKEEEREQRRIEQEHADCERERLKKEQADLREARREAEHRKDTSCETIREPPSAHIAYVQVERSPRAAVPPQRKRSKSEGADANGTEQGRTPSAASLISEQRLARSQTRVAGLDWKAFQLEDDDDRILLRDVQIIRGTLKHSTAARALQNGDGSEDRGAESGESAVSHHDSEAARWRASMKAIIEACKRIATDGTDDALRGELDGLFVRYDHGELDKRTLRAELRALIGKEALQEAIASLSGGTGIQ